MIKGLAERGMVISIKYVRSDFLILDTLPHVRAHTLLAYTPSLPSTSVHILIIREDMTEI